MGPRLYHKKSKTGCLRCRARRVKCDESRPICGDCRRHGVECLYTPKSQHETGCWSVTGVVGDSESISSYATSPSPSREAHVPESRARRMLELKLLYHYADTTCKTLAAIPEPSQVALMIWKDAAIRLAFVSDVMLYSVLAVSAQHLAESNPSDSEASAASLEYLNLALPLHRRDVAELNKANADLVCLTGSLLRVSAFVTLQKRPIEPYTPPTPFLLQARGSIDVFRAVWSYVSDDPDSIAQRMVNRAPYVRDSERASLFGEEHRQSLLHLLHRSPEHLATELWSGDIQSAYEATLSYLGNAQSCSTARAPLSTALSPSGNFHSPIDAETPDTDATKPPDSRLQRLVLFPSLVPETFIRLAVEAKPRALVVLAHYFAALADFEHIWWVSTIGIREIRGLLTALNGLRWESEIVSNLLQALEGTTERRG